jgi:2'-5' RNA ligase
LLTIVEEVPDTFGDIPEDWHFYDPDTGEELKAVDMMRDVMKVACAMIVLPETVAAEVLKINAAMIADADLAGKGREDQPHITVKYGVREDLGQTAEALVEFYPFEVTLGKTKIFEPSANSKGAAVVVVEVIAPILQQLHDKVNDCIGLRHDGTDYVPHITLAYINCRSADSSNASAATTKCVVDGIVTDTYELADFFKAEAFKNHGFDGIDIPRQRVMVCSMLRTLHDPEIVELIVKLVPVDMVDDLSRLKGASKVAFGNQYVLGYGNAPDLEDPVALRIDVANAFAAAIAETVTKLPRRSLVTESRTDKFGTAVSATDGKGTIIESPLTGSGAEISSSPAWWSMEGSAASRASNIKHDSNIADRRTASKTYVAPEIRKKYEGLTDFEGITFTASAVTIKRVNKKEWTFDLGGSRLVSKAGEDEEDEEVEEIILDILKGFEEVVPAMEHELASTHLDSATEMRDALDVESSIQFSVLNEKALQYARKRAAEMVGKKWVDGELVDNPNAVWAITETTRDVLRTLIDDAFGQGQTPAELATSIENTGIFGAWRADLIASTEMARATRQGARDTAKEVGVIGKSSETSGDHTEDNCDGSCDEAEDRGVIALDEDYGVTGHWDGPGCNCVEVFYTADDPEAADLLEPEEVA